MDIGNWDDDSDELAQAAGPAPDIDDLIQFTESISIPPDDDEYEKADLSPLLPGVQDLTKDRGVLLQLQNEHSTGQKPTVEFPYVELHYDGFLVSNGEKFDSSRDQNYSMIFHLDLPPKGKSALIPGLEIGLQNMAAGEQATLTVKSRYAYGKEGSQEIPPNSDLRFELHVLDVRGTHKRLEVVDHSENDLSRLEGIRREREVAQQRREEEASARNAEKSRKADRIAELRWKLANKNKGGKKGGKKKN